MQELAKLAMVPAPNPHDIFSWNKTYGMVHEVCGAVSTFHDIVNTGWGMGVGVG